MSFLKWGIQTYMVKNQILLLSVSALVVSFISSCGKSNNSSSENGTKNRYSTLSFVSEENNDSNFCTDLNDESKNPLGKYQWHLKNTGQTSFASTPGVVGADINELAPIPQLHSCDFLVAKLAYKIISLAI